MHCRSVRKWLHLYGAGELTSGQKKSLDDHLVSCGACKRLSRQISRTREFTALMKNEVPMLDEPELLTGRIVHAVERQSDRKPEKNRRWNFLNGRFSFRMAMGCMLLFLLSSFFIQEVRVMNQVSVLERKIEKPAFIPKSAFAECLAFAEELLPLFNGDAENLIEQAKEGHIRIPSMTHYVTRFQQMPMSDQIRIIHAGRKIIKEYPDLISEIEDYKIEYP